MEMNNQAGLGNEMYVPGSHFLNAYRLPSLEDIPRPGFLDALAEVFGSFADAFTLMLSSPVAEDGLEDLEDLQSIDDFSQTDGYPPKIFVANTLDEYFRFLMDVYSERGTEGVSLGTRAGFEETVAKIICRRIPQLSPSNGLPELCEDLVSQLEVRPITNPSYELRVEQGQIILFPKVDSE